MKCTVKGCGKLGKVRKYTDRDSVCDKHYIEFLEIMIEDHDVEIEKGSYWHIRLLLEPYTPPPEPEPKKSSFGMKM